MAFGDGLSWYPLTERDEWQNRYYNELVDEIQSYYSGTLDGSDFPATALILSEPGQHLVSHGAELLRLEKIFGLDDDDPLDSETDRFVSVATGWDGGNGYMGLTGQNNTTLLQNAFTNGLAANDTALLIPPGQYETPTGWTLPNADRIHVKGFGGGTLLKATADNITLLAFNASATTDVLIEDITFDGGDYYGIGLYITDGVRVRIKNCTFQNFVAGSNASEEAAGVKLDYATVFSSDVIFDGCKFINCNAVHANSDGYGIWYYDADNATRYKRHLITNCQFIGNGGATGDRIGIRMDTVNGWRISNCQFIDLNDGIDLERHNASVGGLCEGLSITNCIFNNCSSVGVRLWLQAASTTASADYALKQINIAGCIFTMPTPGSSVGVMLDSRAAGAGAPYERLTEIICTENIFDNLNIAVHVRGTADVAAQASMCDSIITHNTIWRSAYADGILLHTPSGNGDTQRNIISNNMIVGLVYLLRLTGSDCADNILFGNTLGGASITHITDSGTDTRKAHNALADLTGE